MKKLNKVLVLVLSTIMVLAMSASVFAQEVDSGKGGDATITITLPTQEIAPTGTTTYKIYKVFDATTNGTAISYKLVDGKTAAPSGFTVDSAGNVKYAGGDSVTELTADDIAAIKAYVADDAVYYTATVPKGETEVEITGLEYGYYYITTSTGTVVTVDSTKPNADVEDKNIIPTVKKSAGTQYDATSLKAIAAVGTDQDFTAQITKTKGAVNLVFVDTMTKMTYNGDVKVTVGESEVTPSATINTDAEDETFKVSGAVGDASFTVEFDNDYIAGLADGTVITLNYSGKITSDALSVDPAKNKATLTSGEGNTSESDEVLVYNAKFTVTKNDGSGKPLSGAGFVLKNADGKYYKIADDKKSISWVALADDKEETIKAAIKAGTITEYTSDAQGAVPAFTGLGDGDYTLVESTVPDGYNKAADFSFTVEDDDYTTTNLEQKTTVVNNPGTVMPATGGIGTTIFYILGSLLVVGCGIVLISRKRMENNK